MIIIAPTRDAIFRQLQLQKRNSSYLIQRLLTMNSYKHAALVVLAWIGCFAGLAQAGVIPCQPESLPLVTNTSDCEKSSANQDFLNTNPMTVNQEAFFGFSDWAYISRTEMSDGQGQSGSWSVNSNLWDSYSDLLLVFKDGKDTTLLGYLAVDGATNGTWESPFREPEFDFNPDNKIKNVSHVTYYARGVATSLPESSGLLLLALGLMSLVVVRRRV
jgi:hypothetical protein